MRPVLCAKCGTALDLAQIKTLDKKGKRDKRAKYYHMMCYIMSREGK